MRIFSDVSNSSCGKNFKIHSSSRVINSIIKDDVIINRDVIIDKCRIGNACYLYGNSYLMNCTLDDYSYINSNSSILRASIGKFCSIATHVFIGATLHPMDRITTHPFVFSNQVWKFIDQDDEKALMLRENTDTRIGNDVWIGQGAVILPNVKVRDGAIIGAHAVVTRDVEPYAIVVGNPAKRIKYRFDVDTIRKLLSIKWWDWDKTKLEKNMNDFNHPKTFVDRNEL
jgi:phosphonate metabolism protein (transferase hexapeptide repeat family)